MADWSHYFQFEQDTKFFIDGPWGYNGRGKVLERTERLLVVRIDLDAWGPAPQFKGSLSIKYNQEGKGNQVILYLDGEEPMTDEDATINSWDERQERSIDSVPITCSLRNESDPNEIDFDLMHKGESKDFDLIRR